MTATPLNIWQDCQGEQYIQPISGTLFRLVESQEQIATRQLVDTLAEQALLETLLEQTKPDYAEDVAGLHYLLKTPFRYPPLKWGSRFGSTTEPSIFYGGCNSEVTLAESAYYRFLFWYAIDAPAIKQHMRSEHTLFTVDYCTQSGIQLQHMPFMQYKTDIIHAENYSHTQTLGNAMRQASVEVFEYPSARETSHATCVGLFTARAFCQTQPRSRTQWFCDLNAQSVVFKALEDETLYQFDLTQFLVNGRLPLPAH